MSSDLLSAIFSTEAMGRVFDDAARLRAMLRFEAALAQAEAEAGVIPAEAARCITEACESLDIDGADLAEAARYQTAPAIALVKALTAHCPEPGRGWVHWGATSQDVIDTGLVLQMRDGLALIETDLGAIGDTLSALASAHRDTVMVGRTLLQPALPVTFGFKCAGWLEAVSKCRARLAQAARRGLALQFGGAVGTLAALGPAADEVREGLGRHLDLPVPLAAWHTDRGALLSLCSEVAILCGTAAKIAGDIALMMQPEIGEASEPAGPGRGGSSTMPHKRNPVAAPVIRANALRASGLLSGLIAGMDHAHERGIGGWHAEWASIPELFGLAAGALSHLRETVSGLEVRPERMRENLNAGGGAMMAEALMMALAPQIGRGTAHSLVGDLVRQAQAAGRPLAALARQDRTVTAHLDDAAIDRALDPARYLGVTTSTVDRATAHWETIKQDLKTFTERD